MKKLWKWWHWGIFILIVFLLLILFFCIFSDYESFGEYIGFPGKTVWDFVELALLPIIFKILLNSFAQQNQERRNDFEREMNDLAHERRRIDIYNTYFSHVKDITERAILVKEEEDSDAVGKMEDSTFRLLKSYTYATMRYLDPVSNGIILDFLKNNGYLEIPNEWRFIDINFSGYNFRTMNLKNVHFRKCNFTDAQFSSFILIGCGFEDCKFIRTKWGNVSLISACPMEGNDFTGAEFFNMGFKGINNFRSNKFTKVKMKRKVYELLMTVRKEASDFRENVDIEKIEIFDDSIEDPIR